MDIFRFKQFNVDQTGCAMKVNTDGVLLGALAGRGEPSTILDIGTGTGVIALMLAQRFGKARVEAVEIDEVAAKTAAANFQRSKFSKRMELFASGFEQYLGGTERKNYDLIVSNPPFFLNSLSSGTHQKTLARHTDEGFFKNLAEGVSRHLSDTGVCTMILPPATADVVTATFTEAGLHLRKVIYVGSFRYSEPHREIVTFGRTAKEITERDLIIYEQPKVYSGAYQDLLKDFLTIF